MRNQIKKDSDQEQHQEDAIVIKSNTLKKHTSAIHCSNTLTLLQRKLSNILLFHAFPALDDQEEHKISIKELCNFLGKKGHNYDTVKNAMKGLISTVVEWNVIDENKEEDWTASAILASVNIKGSVCSYAYSPRMRQLLHNPSTYGRVNILIQSSFMSNYGLALYENCVRYQGLPQTKTFSLEMFRKMMGVPEEKYPIFRDFKRRVLDKAVDEVNALSDMMIEPNLTRIGRKVVSISFKLKKREKKQPLAAYLSTKPSEADAESIVEDETNIIEKLVQQYGVIQEKSKSLIKKYGLSKVEEKMVQIESTQAYLSGSIRNLAGYFVDALKNDYLPSKSSDDIRQAMEQKQLAELAKEQQLRDSQEALFLDYASYLHQSIIEILNNLESAQEETVLDEFHDFLEKDIYSDPLVLSFVKANKFSDEIVTKALRKFLSKQYPKLLSAVQSLEEFSKHQSR